MTPKSFTNTYVLSNENIDIIADHIREYLKELEIERSNIIRIRLLMEEALLRWQDRFGDQCSVKLSLEVRLRRPTVTLELAGDYYDPLSSSSELGNWADSLLRSIGLQPRFSYQYQRSVNIVQLKLKSPRLSPALTLLISVALGLLLGIAGEYVLPDAAQTAILETVLAPIQQVFFRLLNAVAGPVIFLSVLSAICSVGSMAELGKSGRGMIRRFLLMSVLAALIAAAVSELFFRPEFSITRLDGTQFNGVLDFFLQFVPPDVLTPFITGDSPQLIIVSLILGYALLAAGNQAGGLVGIVEQANTVALILADWISRITPFFVSLLLILGLWSGSLGPMLGLWKPLLVFLAVAVVFLLQRMLTVSTRHKVSLRKLWEKMKESFMIAFRNASVDTSYGANQVCCERRLGIGSRLVGFGLPLGLVIYMPAMTVAYMAFTVYIAQAMELTVSPLWYIMAMLLNVTLLAATPPVAGVGLLTFAVLFSRLGISHEALVVGMVADILFAFAVAPLDQAMLQVELVLEAGRLGELNTAALQK